MIRQPLISDEKAAIREVIENWVLWRDAGDWDRFATVWHDDGWMTATWFQGPARKFIEVSREGFERGVRSAGTGRSCAGNRFTKRIEWIRSTPPRS